MTPPKKNFLIRRPLFQWDMNALAATDGKGRSYIPPDEVDTPVPFTVPRCVNLPLLYHAGTAWAYDGVAFPPSSDEGFTIDPSSGNLIGYTPCTTKPWGVLGRRLRVPRCVVLCMPSLSMEESDIIGFLSAVAAFADPVGANVVIIRDANSPFLDWAFRCIFQDGTTQLVSTNTPVDVTTWLAGDVLAVVCGVTAYTMMAPPGFGQGLHVIGYVAGVSTDGSDPPIDTPPPAGWEAHYSAPVEHIPTHTSKYALAINRPLIAAERSFWATVAARVGRFQGVSLYDSGITGDAIRDGVDDFAYSWSDFVGLYAPATLWTDEADGLPWTRVDTPGASAGWFLQDSQDVAAAITAWVPKIGDAIASFWPT